MDMALLIEHESSLIQGLEFILSHFNEPVWPRTISTKTTQGKQISVNSKEEVIARFNQANGLDCRIAAYPVYHPSYIKSTGISPDFLFIDLDLGQFESADSDSDSDSANWQNSANSKSKLDRCLKKTLNNIQTRFNDRNLQPTVIWSGNGYHIYLPVEGFVLESQDVFAEYIEYLESARASSYSLQNDSYLTIKQTYVTGKAYRLRIVCYEYRALSTQRIMHEFR